MRTEMVTALDLLRGLREGEVVYLTRDGSRSKVTVQRAFRVDLGGGSQDHAKVTLGYGPGRWNMEVSAAGIVDGYYAVERVEREVGQAQRYRPGIWQDRMREGNCPECGEAPERHGDDNRFWVPNGSLGLGCSLMRRGVEERIAQFVKDNEEQEQYA